MTGVLRIIRWTALGLIVLLILAITVREWGFGGNIAYAPSSGDGAASVPAGIAIGGPFHLTDDKGRAVTDAGYRGRWVLVFFGYTNCPDECPLTLQKMAAALNKLGPLADKIAPLFITVDPARDTPARLASYLANFDPRIIGLTGSDTQIAEAAKVYRVYYAPARHEESGADLVSHSTFLYLMDPAGAFSELLPSDVDADKLAAALRAKLGATP
jgi:cytochrome oxidase Cu insertion factor (SCO1/SenC/PrrC family)